MASCDHAQKPRATTNSSVELAEIFRLHSKDFFDHHAVPHHYHRVIQAIKNCRTAVLGGHQTTCLDCGYQQIAYNSCRDRHCPKCQGIARERWLQCRKAELVPVRYFHVVFTVAHELNPIILANKQKTLNLLFTAVNDTLKVFAKDPQWRVEGKIGFIAVLHTWSQTLMDHFHLHVLVPAGVIDKDGKWRPIRTSFLFANVTIQVAFWFIISNLPG